MGDKKLPISSINLIPDPDTFLWTEITFVSVTSSFTRNRVDSITLTWQ